MLRLLAVLLTLALPAAAQDPAVEQARRSVAAVEALLKQRPEDPTLWFYLSRFQSEAGDIGASVAAMEKVLALGEGLLPAAGDFGKAWGNAQFQAVRAKIEAKLPRVDFAPTAFVIDDRTLIPEGIAWDAGTGEFFIGSVQGKILRLAPDGPVAFAGPESGLDAVLGLAVDSPRRTLYAVSTSALTEAGEKSRRNAVVSFDLDTRKLLRRVSVPEALQLNDVAVVRGGRVFASDSASGAVYEIPATGQAKVLVAPGQVRGTNGIAASPDAKRLYLAHSTGIAVVDLATGTLQRVAVPPRESVAAIDGLYEWEGQLVGVQNVTSPGRVILLTLAPGGAAITRVQTLLSHHHPVLNEPTTGAVTDKGFFLLAATGFSHYNRQGRLERPESVPKPTVLRVLLPR